MAKATKNAKKRTRARPVSFEAALLARLRRVTEGYSYAEVGAVTGVHQETVRRYLQGHSSPSVEFVAAVSRTTGVSADWLLHGGRKLTPESVLDGLPLSFVLDRLAKRCAGR